MCANTFRGSLDWGNRASVEKFQKTSGRFISPGKIMVEGYIDRFLFVEVAHVLSPSARAKRSEAMEQSARQAPAGSGIFKSKELSTGVTAH